MANEIMVLRCMPKIEIDGYSHDYDLHVLDMNAVVIPRFELMCGAIHDSIHIRYVSAVLADIDAIQSGALRLCEEETEGWRYQISPEGVRFEGKFDQGVGGEVSVDQFRLALETFLRYLQDVFPRPLEVVFPEK